MPTTSSSFFIQSTLGIKGNFEVAIPRQGGGVALFYRDNDSPAQAWNGPLIGFGSDADVSHVSLIQSNYGAMGNLEVVFLAGTKLGHSWRDSASGRWQTVTWLPGTAKISGNPAFIQGRIGIKGNYEVVAPVAGGGMAHWWRANDLPGMPWGGPELFGSGPIDAVALAQSNIGAPGNLEVVARVGRRLAYYFRDGAGWHGPQLFAQKVAGTPCLIQSTIGSPGNFEVAAPFFNGKIGHWWRAGGDPATPWQGPETFGTGKASAVGLIQSNYGNPGNLELVARLDDQLAHYYRDAGGVWHGPQSFGAEPPCQAKTGGKADIPYRSGIVGVHLGLMHTGKIVVFSFADDSDHHGESRVLNPANGNVEEPAMSDHAMPNLFCSGHTFLPSGELLVVGGHHEDSVQIHTFDPHHQAWTAHAPMADGRWYPTCVTLPDGRGLTISGTKGEGGPVSPTVPINNTLQIFDPASGMGPAEPLPLPFSDFFPSFFQTIDLYPFVYVLPNGQLLVHSRNTSRLYNLPAAGGAGSWTSDQFPTVFPTSRTYPFQGTSVLLPLLPGASPAYRPRVLVIGGSGNESFDDFAPATPTCEILDLGASLPKWESIAPMSSPRVLFDAVLLPNGKVLVVGGSSSGRSNVGADPVFDVEWLDPITLTWTKLCSTRVPRLYHSTALLLPDASVLIAGKDGLFQTPAYQYPEHRCEVFKPPYLFASSRPRITHAPATVAYGAAIAIDTPNAASIASVALIRPGSVTHSFNSDQRYVGLTFNRSGAKIVAQAPPNSKVAPPGFYMLFIVNGQGVPSVASWVKLG